MNDRNFIYEGNDLSVFSKIKPDTSLFVIVFGAFFEGDLKSEVFGEKFLDKKNISAVFIVPHKNHWYQSTELFKVIEIINQNYKQYKNRVVFGSSMGGFGGFVTAPFLSAKRALLFSPQIELINSEQYLNPKWIACLNEVEIIHKNHDFNLYKNIDLLIIYDPINTRDSLQVSLLKNKVKAKKYLVPFAGHETMKYLKATSQLSEITHMLLLGHMSTSEFRKIIRKNRKSNPYYFFGIAKKLYEKGLLENAFGMILEAEKIAIKLEFSDRILNEIEKYKTLINKKLKV